MMKRLILWVLVLLSPATASAQLSAGGTPPSLDPAVAGHLTDAFPTEVLPAVDVEALLAQDLANEGRKDMPWRFGHNLYVNLDLDDGKWVTLPDGDRVWRLGIRSPGALSINLAFDRYRLPPGAQLFVRSADGEHVIGAFTDANNRSHGRMATTLVWGDEIVLEYVEPASRPFDGELSLSRVTHGYRSPGKEARDLGDSGSCNYNVYCPLSTGWEDPIRSAVMLVVQGNGFCSGAMVNNTSGDGAPYLLTAEHCYSDPSSWVFWFNWESPDCNDPGNSPNYDSLAGASLLAKHSSPDFALLELDDTLPPEYNVYLSGWDYTGVAPTASTCIHHPSGDIKKFTQNYDTLSPSNYSGSGSHWEVGEWEEGTTEGGSSGSPLFDQDQRIVGQLTGGTAACSGSNPNNQPDYYGQFARSWDDGNDASSRLRDWLDPANLDPGLTDGLDTAVPLFDLDAGIRSVLSPVHDSLYCSSPVAAELTLMNRGAQDLTAVDVGYRIDGGAWANQAWTGNLEFGDTEQVILPDLDVDAATHTFEVAVSSPNGAADENPANDTGSAEFTVYDSSATALPVFADFEDPTFPPDGWTVDNPDDGEEWHRTDDAGGFGESEASAMMMNYRADGRGEYDYLTTPFLDLTTAETPIELVFDLAHAPRGDHSEDEFFIQVSNDCGQTWDELLHLVGNSLETATEHEDEFVPEDDEWRTQTVSLDDWMDETNLLIAFVNVNNRRNNLYIDNIAIRTEETGDDDDSAADDDDSADDDDTTPPVDDDDDDDGCKCVGAQGEGASPMALMLLALVALLARRFRT